MPVLVLKDRCDNLARCFAASVCPNQALLYDEKSGQIVVLPERCGDCRGPCLNFCDRYALKYAPTMAELRLLQAEQDGTMTAEEIAKERLRLKQAEDARRKSTIPDVTAAAFQRDVLQARLPVLVVVDSPRSPTSKQLGPALEQVAQAFFGQLMVRRVNADAEQQLVAALRVRNVPTFLFFYQGQLADGVEGAVSAAQLQGWVQQLLEQLQAMENQPEPPAPKGKGQPGAGPATILRKPDWK